MKSHGKPVFRKSLDELKELISSTKLPVKLSKQKEVPEKKLKARKKHPLNLSYC